MDELITASLGHDAAAPRPIAGAGVASVAAALPERVVGNEEIAARVGVTPEWIVERTGVRERRVADPGIKLTELAARAGSSALETAGVEPAEVDLVLVGTMSHDYLTPSAAPLTARAMGCERAGAMDVGAACTAFVSALGLATGQIESGRCGTAVVIGADILTRFTDRDDRSTAALFGDGAGAVVLRRTPGSGRVGPTVFGSDGARAELIETGREEALIRMKGPDTYRQAVDRLAEAGAEAARLAGVPLGEVDLFAFHQANARILAAVAERLGLPEDRVINSIRHVGNTSAASIPLALAQAQAEGLLADGTRVLLAAFGGGLTWGATVLEWGLGDG
ncbi:MAG: beta-ketoacyl-ACP synthase III [Actinobacteria bacterium]|nr:beta-ketoacyl-ACP synthase III [Actinomycetota bacterium]